MTEALEMVFAVLGLLGVLASCAFDFAVAPHGLATRARLLAVRGPLLIAVACFAIRAFVADHSIVVVALWAATATAILVRFIAQMPAARRALLRKHPGS